MADDDLHQPLGLAGAPRARRDIPYKTLGLAGLGLVVLGLAGFLLATGDPHGGEPYAVATIPPPRPTPPRPPEPPAVPADPAVTGTTAPRGPASAAQLESESGVKVVRPGGALAPDSVIIEVPPPAVRVRLAPAPDPRLVERTPLGLLPRIGPAGALPRDVYARPVDLPVGLPRTAPRIALVVGGTGLNPAATAAAIQDLPPAVTLAFAPYGADLARDAAQARAQGHETLLQAPMAAFDGAAPGPHTLETGASAPEVLADLHWLMTRFTGYVGVGNFLGAKFTADPASLGPVLQELADRGLFYFDDGSSARSTAARLAGKLALPFARADVLLDAGATRGVGFDAALLKLEAIARAKGTAIGMANDLPGNVEQMARFARGLEARGIALVPLSALVTTAPDVAVRAP